MADLDELERLLAAASPRPWSAHEYRTRRGATYWTVHGGVGHAAVGVFDDGSHGADEVPMCSTEDRDAIVALVNAAPALIAAARAAQHRGETLERVAEAVGYPRGAHYGDVLGRIDELVAERDRLRAAVDGVLADVARWREHTEARARGGQHFGTSGEIGQLSHSTAEYLERRLGRHVGGAAGGGT